MRTPTVLTVTYGRADLLELQSAMLSKFMPCNYRHVITDALDNLEIESVAETHNIKRLVCTQVFAMNASDSHARALNYAFENGIACEENSPLIVLDSDIFPIEPIEFRSEYHIITRRESRGNVNYFWPGFVIINHKNASELRWNTGTFFENLCDTGGATSLWIDKYKPHILWSECREAENFDFEYLDSGRWAHFMNGSNWRKDNSYRQSTRWKKFTNFLAGKYKGIKYEC